MKKLILCLVVLSVLLMACAPNAEQVAKAVLEDPKFQKVADDASAARIAADQAKSSAGEAKTAAQGAKADARQAWEAVQAISDTLVSPLGIAALIPAQETMPLTATVLTVTTSGIVSGTWNEVDFHPTGDKVDVVNVDHAGKYRVTIAWFWAGPAEKPPTEACTAHVTTDQKGERITLRGAFRTWEWVGSSKPTKADIQKLVADWISVLEAEPRGACAYKGAYQVSWQDPTLAP